MGNINEYFDSGRAEFMVLGCMKIIYAALIFILCLTATWNILVTRIRKRNIAIDTYLNVSMIVMTISTFYTCWLTATCKSKLAKEYTGEQVYLAIGYGVWCLITFSLWFRVHGLYLKLKYKNMLWDKSFPKPDVKVLQRPHRKKAILITVLEIIGGISALVIGIGLFSRNYRMYVRGRHIGSMLNVTNLVYGGLDFLIRPIAAGFLLRGTLSRRKSRMTTYLVLSMIGNVLSLANIGWQFYLWHVNGDDIDFWHVSIVLCNAIWFHIRFPSWIWAYRVQATFKFQTRTEQESFPKDDAELTEELHRPSMKYKSTITKMKRKNPAVGIEMANDKCGLDEEHENENGNV